MENYAAIRFGEFSKICRSRDNTRINGCHKYDDGCDEKCTYWQSIKISNGHLLIIESDGE